MPKEQTAYDSRSYDNEEQYRDMELGAGASCNDAVDNDAEAKALKRDGKLPPPGKFNESYDGADGAGFVTNTKI